MSSMDAETIEYWALKNPKAAVQLGRDIYEASQSGEEPPSRGPVQDEIVEWAKANPTRAKVLFIKLMGKLAKHA